MCKEFFNSLFKRLLFFKEPADLFDLLRTTRTDVVKTGSELLRTGNQEGRSTGRTTEPHSV